MCIGAPLLNGPGDETDLSRYDVWFLLCVVLVFFSNTHPILTIIQRTMCGVVCAWQSYIPRKADAPLCTRLIRASLGRLEHGGYRWSIDPATLPFASTVVVAEIVRPTWDGVKPYTLRLCHPVTTTTKQAAAPMPSPRPE